MCMNPVIAVVNSYLWRYVKFPKKYLWKEYKDHWSILLYEEKVQVEKLLYIIEKSYVGLVLHV